MDSSAWQLSGWAAAIGAGLLIGIERERSQNAAEQSPAGMRSFLLAALAGAVAGTLGPAALGVTLVAVALHSYAGYVQTRVQDPGLTTELALLLTLLLGALAMRAPALAAGLAVLVSLVLWAKPQLHGFVRSVLTEPEITHGLLLAAAVLVVLPLLPNRPLPWLAGLNPHALWLLAVLLMLVQTLGHLAMRRFGRSRGLALAGLAGGFVSSTATIAGMAQRAREQPDLRAACLGAAQLSNLATVIELAVIVGVLDAGLLPRFWPALLAYGAGAAVAALWALGWKVPEAGAGGQDAWLSQRPFNPRSALLFALLLSLLLLLARQAIAVFGAQGVVLALGLAGFADAHAASASAAQLAASGLLSDTLALTAMAAAVSCNAVSKVFAGFLGGDGTFGWTMAVSQAGLLALLWLGVLVPLPL
ncbi:conserved membrane hypothetical protein [Thiomonas sp. X19]|uniref:DUF4010 domain-containing protein n=1 Tax=Thiomonas sp. X19 TaxID=1050370 RepID=UPI000B6FCCC7|nr:DUF4010 domain-containing protein [Thiomonas sp. X19]SCC93273.1 conserved membrane hypothetical protein [Thiomonas sp. X19]